jgi:hypothetical protein
MERHSQIVEKRKLHSKIEDSLGDVWIVCNQVRTKLELPIGMKK